MRNMLHFHKHLHKHSVRPCAAKPCPEQRSLALSTSYSVSSGIQPLARLLDAAALVAEQIVHADKIFASKSEAREILAPEERVAIAHADSVAIADILCGQQFGKLCFGASLGGIQFILIVSVFIICFSPCCKSVFNVRVLRSTQKTAERSRNRRVFLLPDCIVSLKKRY